VTAPGPAPGGWAGPRPFVGRDRLLVDALRLLDRAAEGQGGLLFVVGDIGAGKHRFVARLLEANDTRPRPLGVVEAWPGERSNVWIALARRVTRRRRIRRFLLAVLPEWIGALPVIGQLLGAIVQTVQTLRGREAEPVRESRVTARRQAGAVAAVDEFLGELRGPTLVVLRRFDRANDDDLAGAFHAIRTLAGHPVLVVATARHRPGQRGGRVQDLMGEAERYSAATVVRLGELHPDEWHRALTEASGSPPPPAWTAWFARNGPLLPADLWILLGQVEALGGLVRSGRVYRWADAPDTADPAAPGAAYLAGTGAPDRLEGLDPEDRALLAAAIQGGAPFPAARLTGHGGGDELAVQDRLARLERAGWIRYVETRGQGEELSDWYDFARPGLVAALLGWSGESPSRDP
jgi:hypothetical protein